MDIKALKCISSSQCFQIDTSSNASTQKICTHIVFGSGHYSPGTERGDTLLAHELTHVVQQGASVKRKEEAPPPKQRQQRRSKGEKSPSSSSQIATPSISRKLRESQSNGAVNRNAIPGGLGESIQARLKISQPGDQYEEEADRVANQVMRMPDPHVQRQEDEEEAQAKPLDDATAQPQEDEEKNRCAQGSTCMRSAVTKSDRTRRVRLSTTADIGCLRGTGNISTAQSGIVQRDYESRQVAGKTGTDLIWGDLKLPIGSFTIQKNRILGGHLAGELRIGTKILSSLRRGKLPKIINYRIWKHDRSIIVKGNLYSDAKQGTVLQYASLTHPHGWIRTRYGWKHGGPKKKSMAGCKGYNIRGGKLVSTVLNRLYNVGGKQKNTKPKLTTEEYNAITAVAEVENGGLVGLANTYDDMFISIGFKGITIGSGSLQEVIAKVNSKASSAFKKHDIYIGAGTYKKGWYGCAWIKYNNLKKIKGASDPRVLRKHKWALRFYAASLEDDVVKATVDLLKEDLKFVTEKSKTRLKGMRRNLYQNIIFKSILMELRTHRPNYVDKVLRKMAQLGARSTTSLYHFIYTYLRPAMFAVYPKTKLGRGQVYTIVGDIVSFYKKKGRKIPSP